MAKVDKARSLSPAESGSRPRECASGAFEFNRGGGGVFEEFAFVS